MEMPLELIKNLSELYFEIKTCHWNAKDYSKHLLFDRLKDDLLDDVDSIVESIIMLRGNIVEFPSLEIVSYPSSELIFNKFSYVFNLIENYLKSDATIDEGAISLLSDIQKNISTKIYLIKMAK